MSVAETLIYVGGRCENPAMAPMSWKTCFIPLGKNTKTLEVFTERPGSGEATLKALSEQLLEHYVGRITLLKAGGLPNAAFLVENSLPADKRLRSGDLGELLALEFVNASTTFAVPIMKLRWKDDRDMPLHGNDIVGTVKNGARIRVLKGECKSKVSFTASQVKPAFDALDRHGGRPNPSTLAFMTKRLFEMDRDPEALVYLDLQGKGKIKLSDVEHLLFVVSGNDPRSVLGSLPVPRKRIRRRWAVAVVLRDHGSFIERVFERTRGK